MNYYNEIKEKLIKCEIYNKAKDYTKEQNKVKVYFETGRLLSEAGREYGKSIIKNYSIKLMNEVGKKYNERTLRRIRQFYEVFSNEKWSTTWTKLYWSHYREVLALKNYDEIEYYLNECENKNLTVKQLQFMIKNKEYERLSKEAHYKLRNKRKLKLPDMVPNPILIKGDLEQELSEYALKQLILNNIDDFLLQLGNGFAYIGSEYRIKIGNQYNYIDLLLFNIDYNCYVVVELKITELKKEHIGQIEVYMNYIDSNIRKITQDKTIGIIICKKNNRYVIEYCSDERIISRSYKII